MCSGRPRKAIWEGGLGGTLQRNARAQSLPVTECLESFETEPKGKKQNPTTVTNSQAGISKELREELGPDNTILHKKCDLPAATVVQSMLWTFEMQRSANRAEATACFPKAEPCLPGLGASILATWEI